MFRARTPALGSFAVISLLLCTLVVISPPQAHASKTAGISIVSTLSSSSCEDPASSATWSCDLYATQGSVIVVFLGCLSPDTGCLDDLVKVTDAQNDSFAPIINTLAPCASGGGCHEASLWAAHNTTGVTAISFTSSEKEFFSADLFDIVGVNASVRPIGSGYGTEADGVPDVSLSPNTPFTGGIVLAGVVAGDAQTFSAGTGFTLIPDQPCPSGCGSSVGDGQASEYTYPASSSSGTAPFGYPSTNAGWQEAVVTFAPLTVSAKVSCAQPFIAAMASSCTVTVIGENATGNVSWSSNSTGMFSPTTCALSQGRCTVSYTPSSTAPSNVTAAYAGDSSNPATTGSFLLRAAKDTPQVSVSCTPSQVPVESITTCTATVTGASPTGAITWASSGVANFSPSDACTLSTGACAVDYTPSTSTSPVSITAVYSGDANNNGSSGVFSLSVATATTLSSSNTTSSIATTVQSSISSTSTKSSTSSVTTTASTTAPATSSSTTSSSASATLSSASTTSSKTSTEASSSSFGGSFIAFFAVNVTVLAILGLRMVQRHGARSSRSRASSCPGGGHIERS